MNKKMLILITTLFIFIVSSFGSAVATDDQNLTSSPQSTPINYSNTPPADNSSLDQTTITNKQTSGYEGVADPVNIKGFWINDGTAVLNNMNITALKKASITDLFVSISKQNPEGTLKPLVDYFSGSGIRIHAWVTCFRSQNGSWINPVEDPASIDQLVNTITSIATNYNVDGIHLDSVRYPGTAYLYPNATQNVTSFVQRVYNNIQNINSQQIPGKKQILLSAALMPERGANGYYYGQDYGQLAPYLDFLVPMVYKGNYQADTAWVGATTQYIVQHAGGKPVVAGLQTYRSDSYPVPIPGCELNSDIAAAANNGSSGYVLFKYGLTDMSGIVNYKTATLAQITAAASIVKSYIESNQQLPSNTTIGNLQVNMPTFLYLLSKSITCISQGNFSSINIMDFKAPLSPSGTLKNGNITKNEYLNIALKIQNFMAANGLAPNYASSSLGTIRYESLIYAFSISLDYYGANKVLPTYISIIPWSQPKILSTNPASNATEVSLTSPITLTFNKNILAGANYTGIYLKNTASGAVVTVTKSISGNTLTIQQTTIRKNNTLYQVYIPAGAVKDTDGNSLAAAYTYTFNTIPTTTDTTPPTVTSTTPTNNATGVSISSPITIKLSENIVSGTSYTGIYIKNMVSGAMVTITKSLSGNTLTLVQTASRMYNTLYQVYIPAGAVKDMAGNSLAAAYTYNFTTIPATNDTTPPTVTSTNPASNATGVNLTSPITLNFSENIFTSTNYSGIYIKNLSTGKLVTIASKTVSGKTLTINMTYTRLSKNNYQVFIPAGALKDTVGNGLAANYSYKFITI